MKKLTPLGLTLIVVNFKVVVSHHRLLIQLWLNGLGRFSEQWAVSLFIVLGEIVRSPVEGGLPGVGQSLAEFGSEMLTRLFLGDVQHLGTSTFII